MAANKTKLNPVTEKEEPYVSSKIRMQRIAWSCSTLLFMVKNVKFIAFVNFAHTLAAGLDWCFKRYWLCQRFCS